ncbi:unnamed protein product [Moneuplotes crassus]|uniref:GMP phosphodiesterase delta subunit domain-containing protein n=1 Tax=Euplotes crassus TaxID=5936 RepID=A0AAD2D8P8_EUPCR|nr:unnamed protein product [Moneuplotes crassus]
MEGFKINWMKMKDAETQKLLWECQEWDHNCELTERFPKEILECKCVSLEINFSSRDKIENFRIIQKVSLMGNVIEEWDFKFGFVMPSSVNNWEQIIDAADKEEMIPAEILSGNMVVQTYFYSGEEVIHTTKMTVIYE